MKPSYSDWYAGMTTKGNSRYNHHKREKELEELAHYGKFYLHSMSNARVLESILNRDYNMGNYDLAGGIGKNSTYIYVFHYPKARLNGII